MGKERLNTKSVLRYLKAPRYTEETKKAVQDIMDLDAIDRDGILLDLLLQAYEVPQVKDVGTGGNKQSFLQEATRSALDTMKS